jgi:type VI secretion system Hcp family effector
MSLHAYAQLTANGSPLTGDTTASSMGNTDISTDHIELFAVEWGSRTETSDSTTTRLRTSHLKDPVRLVKRVDQTSPIFFQALKQNYSIAGRIKLFDTGEDGSARHRFTLTLAKARISSVRGQLHDVLDSANAGRPPLETIEIVAASITYTDEVHSVEYHDG